MKYVRINSDESMESKEYSSYRVYKNWKKWMELGLKSGCHQRADRSFFIRGYQMPVCARCTGVMIGYLIAIPVFFLAGFSKLISAVGCVILVADWVIQAAGFKESTNLRRLITGAAGGYGLMSFQLFFIKKVFKFFSRTHR